MLALWNTGRSPRPVQFDSRWKARECSSLERLIPQGERNCRNNTACMTSTRDFSFVKLTSNSANRVRAPNLQVLETVKTSKSREWPQGKTSG